MGDSKVTVWEKIKDGEADGDMLKKKRKRGICGSDFTLGHSDREPRTTHTHTPLCVIIWVTVNTHKRHILSLFTLLLLRSSFWIPAAWREPAGRIQGV